jgi:hypothetical protein
VTTPWMSRDSQDLEAGRDWSRPPVPETCRSDLPLRPLLSDLVLAILAHALGSLLSGELRDNLVAVCRVRPRRPRDRRIEGFARIDPRISRFLLFLRLGEGLSMRLRRADFPGLALLSRPPCARAFRYADRSSAFVIVDDPQPTILASSLRPGKNPPCFLTCASARLMASCQVIVSACDAFGASPPLLSRAEPLTMASTIGKIASRNAAAMSAAFVRFTCVVPVVFEAPPGSRQQPRATRRASRCREPVADPRELPAFITKSITRSRLPMTAACSRVSFGSERPIQIRPREQAVLGEPPFVAADLRHSERPDGPPGSADAIRRSRPTSGSRIPPARARSPEATRPPRSPRLSLREPHPGPPFPGGWSLRRSTSPAPTRQQDRPLFGHRELVDVH